MLDYKPNMVLSTKEYRVVGTRPIRHDGMDKVTGRARYSADIQLPGLLHGKILRSPHPHARIMSINASKALALPGVKALVTSEDLPVLSDRVVDAAEGFFDNMRFLSNNCLARDKVLYQGQPVVAVAATSPHIAEEALSLIDVQYEVLPHVLNSRDAIKEDAPILHERLMTRLEAALPNGTGDILQGRGTNVAANFEHRLGILSKGFRRPTSSSSESSTPSSSTRGTSNPNPPPPCGTPMGT